MESKPEVCANNASAAIVAIEDYADKSWEKLDKLADAASDLAKALAAGGIVNAFSKGLSGGNIRRWVRRGIELLHLERSMAIPSWSRDPRSGESIGKPLVGHPPLLCRRAAPGRRGTRHRLGLERRIHL